MRGLLLCISMTVGLLTGCGEEPPAALLGSAKNYLAKKDAKAAVIQLKRALQQQPDLARNIIKGWMEGVAFALSPKMKPAVIASIMRNLKINDAELAERGYQDLLQVTDRKPSPSLEGLRNVQRLMAQRNPAVGNLKTENLIDGRIIRELDESGFIDQLYAAYAVK